MVKPTVRSPRSIAEDKNDPSGFQGDAGYDPVAGAPTSAGLSRVKEQEYDAHPVNEPVPPKEWVANPVK